MGKMHKVINRFVERDVEEYLNTNTLENFRNNRFKFYDMLYSALKNARPHSDYYWSDDEKPSESVLEFACAITGLFTCVESKETPECTEIRHYIHFGLTMREHVENQLETIRNKRRKLEMEEEKLKQHLTQLS